MLRISESKLLFKKQNENEAGKTNDEKQTLQVIAGIILVLAIVAFIVVFINEYIMNKETTAVKENEATWAPLITDDSILQATLEQINKKHKQPAMACALVNGKNIITQAAVGTAVYGENIPVNLNSRFHIGSTTKSLTALLIEMLVNERKLSYDTTLEQALPGVFMREEYRTVTIHDLLLSKAGIFPLQRSDIDDPVIFKKLWFDIPANFPDPQEQRREITKYTLNLPPINEPGTKAVYSNVGWAIAGHIIEIIEEKPYEEVLQEKIFKPLGMNDARVGGWPASVKEPDQPRGHYPVSGGLPQPQELVNNPYIFPDWMSPAGGVHCTITDYALYVMENLAGLEGHGKLLNKKGYENIHTIHMTTKVADMYLYALPSAQIEETVNMGYGWAITTFQGNDLSTADGSGGTFYATIMVYPALEVAFAGFTNCGDGSPALQEAIIQITGLGDTPDKTTANNGATATPVNKLQEKTREWVELLAAEKFDQSADYCGKTFLEQIPVARIKNTWDSLISQVGGYQNISSFSSTVKDNLDYVTATCNFKNAVIDIQVIYDPEGIIVGLNIKPAS